MFHKMKTFSILHVLLFASVCIAQELLLNPSFENGISDWKHDAFTMDEETTVVHGGNTAVKCYGRTQSWQGPAQDVNLTLGGRYAFSSYFRLIEDLPPKGPQPAMIKIAIGYDDGTTDYFELTSRVRVTPADGWVQLGSDFIFPNKPYTSAKLYLEGPAPEVSFYFDDASLMEIPENTEWEAEANQRIETLRKSTIHLNFHVGSHFNASDIEVQIDHVRHLFGFGSMAGSDYIIGDGYKPYQNIVHHMFNWVTIGDYKWRYNRGTRDNPDYKAAVEATDALRKHGIKVRGHNMFWAVKGNEPDYVTPLTGQDLKDAVDEHLEYMTNITKGKLSHWDVNNELLHGRFFEDGTGDENYTFHMFQGIHAADHHPALFLNDYDVVAGGGHTLEYLDQIRTFKAAKVNLGGAGVQSHLQDFMEPDATLIKARLDHLAKADVPLWVTELDLSAPDENKRADWYEKVLRLYFSHPAVHGVIFWGFWDHETDPLKALVHGYEYTLDEAGKRFLRLTKNDWSTHVNRSLANGTSFDLSGFQGDYNVTVWYRGKPIEHKTFSVGKDDKKVNININGDGKEIQLPPVIDPFAKVDIISETTSQNLQTLGQAASTSNSSELTCVTRRSAESEVGDDKFIDVSCNSGEVLTGCSSYLKNNDWRRDGEQIVLTNGQVVCRAIDGFWSTVGTQAVARCCSLQGLSCSYRTAGPSGTGVDDQVLVPCADSEYPFGCSTWTFQSASDGALIANNSCISQNDDVQAGVYSYAACCQGGTITCSSVLSSPSGQNLGDKVSVGCPTGSVLTGCNVYTKNGRAAGAYIEEKDGVDVCTAVNAFPRYGDEIGVQAIVSCCHT
ncbi:hypothetical protein BsWGS_00375 [Bradybaena similaris]